MATIHRTTHSTTVAAPAETVYGLIADAGSWPRVFPPTVHAEVTPLGGGRQALELWATANGEVKHWTSERELDEGALTVTFRQRVSQPPVAAMGGTWTIRPSSAGGCEVVLDHDYAAVGDTPDNVAWIERAIDRNSAAELANLKAAAEQAGQLGDLLLDFSDQVRIAGAVSDVHDFVWRADAWERRLPHVARVALSEPGPSLQVLEMDTRAPDGSSHTTESVRVDIGPHRIVYKQLRLPALLSAHVGEWTFVETAVGVLATSRHIVVVKPSAVTQVLGDAATLADARAFVRKALGTNSLATLGHAKDFAERSGSLATG